MTTEDLDHHDSPVPTRPERRAHGLTPLLRRLHFYTGVFIGPFLLVAAVTGLMYAVIPQIDQFVYRHELTVDHVGEQRLPLADQLTAARTAHPEGSVSSIRAPSTPAETTQVTLTVDNVAPDYARTVFVDPYTGEVRGALTTHGQWMPVRAWFDELHRNLHLGAVGRNYSELAVLRHGRWAVHRYAARSGGCRRWPQWRSSPRPSRWAGSCRCSASACWHSWFSTPWRAR